MVFHKKQKKRIKRLARKLETKFETSLVVVMMIVMFHKNQGKYECVILVLVAVVKLFNKKDVYL